MVGDVREQVRRRYAAAADAATGGGRTSLEVLDECGPGCCSTETGPAFGGDLYNDRQRADPPSGGSRVGCIAGAPSRSEYLWLLHDAIVRARKAAV